jgi:tRNA (guanine-N7-)-methyltransferase
MRPNHLVYPFKDPASKAIFVQDRVWYVPWNDVDTATYTFPGWNAPEFFGNDQPVKVEYCSGNGTWIAAQAQQNPKVNWVAVERKFDRARRVWSKIHNLQLSNLMVIYGEALQVTSAYFPASSLAGVYVNFPDPWPKRHHERHRLIAAPFVEQIARCLNDDAIAMMVTDDVPYSEAMIATFGAEPTFKPVLPHPYYTEEWDNYGSSYFENLWRSKGCAIRYHLFKRLPHGC